MSLIKVPYLDQVEIADMREDLMHLLSLNFHLSLGSRDRPVWDWDPKRAFSFRRIYLRLNNGRLRCPFAKVVWVVTTPVRVFFLLVINNSILTWDNLMKRDWQERVVWMLCIADEESIDHVCLRCPFSI